MLQLKPAAIPSDCWHGGQGFSLSGFLGHLVTPLPASHIRPPKVEIDWQASGNPEGKPLTHRQLTLQPRLCLENSLGTQFLVSPSRPGLAWKQNRSTGREFSCSSWRWVPEVGGFLLGSARHPPSRTRPKKYMTNKGLAMRDSVVVVGSRAREGNPQKNPTIGT